MKKLVVILLVLISMCLAGAAVATEEPPTLEAKAAELAEAVEANPINFAEVVRATIDWWGQVFIRFGKSAKPNVVFNDETVPGLQITLYDQPNWALVGGIVWRYEDVDMRDQPTFGAIEWKGFPLLSGLSDIFTKLNPQVVYTEGEFKLGLTYEFVPTE